LESVTTKAILQPTIDGVMFYGENTGLSTRSFDIQTIKKHYPPEFTDKIWSQWKEDKESLEDFMERIQEVNPAKPCIGFFTFDPKDPKYFFPHLVRFLIRSLNTYTNVYTASISSYDF